MLDCFNRMNGLHRSLHSMLSLVLQTSCPLCQRSTPQALCLDCHRQLQHCQLLPAEQLQPGPLSIFAWGHYNGSLKRAIAAFKYENQPQLAQPLAEGLATAWMTARGRSQPRPIVVPIPIHASKHQQRGFNQAELLAESFCQLTRLPLQQGLDRAKATTAQFQLSPSERERNLSDAFILGKAFQQRPPSAPVWLLDDIYTTGATVRSAAQTLRRQGIRVRGVLVLARA